MSVPFICCWDMCPNLCYSRNRLHKVPSNTNSFVFMVSQCIVAFIEIFPWNEFRSVAKIIGWSPKHCHSVAFFCIQLCRFPLCLRSLARPYNFARQLLLIMNSFPQAPPFTYSWTRMCWLCSNTLFIALILCAFIELCAFIVRFVRWLYTYVIHSSSFFVRPSSNHRSYAYVQYL